MSGQPGGHRAAALAGVAATAALVLAGCGGSPPNSAGGSGRPASGGSSAAGSSASPAAASGGAALVAYFPAAPGNTWVYRETVAGLTSRTIDRMTAVRPTSAGELVSVTHTVSYPVAKTTKETLVFGSDGSVRVPLTQFGGTSVTISSGSVFWPSAASLASGQAHTSTIVMRVRQGGQARTMTLPVTVKGEGTATVTVPAGTYHAMVIGEVITIGVPGYKISVAVRTWVADGVGPVKSETFTGLSGKTTPVSTEELVSFTRG
jgi:hypothetical protein